MVEVDKEEAWPGMPEAVVEDKAAAGRNSSLQSGPTHQLNSSEPLTTHETF